MQYKTCYKYNSCSYAAFMIRTCFWSVFPQAVSLRLLRGKIYFAKGLNCCIIQLIYNLRFTISLSVCYRLCPSLSVCMSVTVSVLLCPSVSAHVLTSITAIFQINARKRQLHRRMRPSFVGSVFSLGASLNIDSSEHRMT